MNSGIIDYNSFIMIIKKIELYKDNEEKLINENLSISVYLDENPSNSKIQKMNDSFGRYERDFNE